MQVINLFGGPGTGKSTLAASLFATIKMRGIGVPTFLIRTAPGYYHTSPCIGPGDTFIRLTDLEKLPFSD